jgi:hypothetical protein
MVVAIVICADARFGCRSAINSRCDESSIGVPHLGVHRHQEEFTKIIIYGKTTFRSGGRKKLQTCRS